METLIINQQNNVTYDQDIEQTILRAAAAAAAVLNLPPRSELSIILVDNAYIRELNTLYRGVNRETDVLSFAMNELQEEEFPPGSQGEVILLGDIVISLEKALEQSEEYGHSFSRETAYLMVHGLLHLVGFDHETEEGKSTMREMEEKILQRISLDR